MDWGFILLTLVELFTLHVEAVLNFTINFCFLKGYDFLRNLDDSSSSCLYCAKVLRCKLQISPPRAPINQLDRKKLKHVSHQHSPFKARITLHISVENEQK